MVFWSFKIYPFYMFFFFQIELKQNNNIALRSKSNSCIVPLVCNLIKSNVNLVPEFPDTMNMIKQIILTPYCIKHAYNSSSRNHQNDRVWRYKAATDYKLGTGCCGKTWPSSSSLTRPDDIPWPRDTPGTATARHDIIRKFDSLGSHNF